MAYRRRYSRGGYGRRSSATRAAYRAGYAAGRRGRRARRRSSFRRGRRMVIAGQRF